MRDCNRGDDIAVGHFFQKKMEMQTLRTATFTRFPQFATDLLSNFNEELETLKRPCLIVDTDTRFESVVSEMICFDWTNKRVITFIYEEFTNGFILKSYEKIADLILHRLCIDAGKKAVDDKCLLLHRFLMCFAVKLSLDENGDYMLAIDKFNEKQRTCKLYMHNKLNSYETIIDMDLDTQELSFLKRYYHKLDANY